jgi:hypothetical protein
VDKEETKRRTAQENMLKDYPGALKSGSCGSLKSGSCGSLKSGSCGSLKLGKGA